MTSALRAIVVALALVACACGGGPTAPSSVSVPSVGTNPGGNTSLPPIGVGRAYLLAAGSAYTRRFPDGTYTVYAEGLPPGALEAAIAFHTPRLGRVTLVPTNNPVGAAITIKIAEAPTNNSFDPCGKASQSNISAPSGGSIVLYLGRDGCPMTKAAEFAAHDLGHLLGLWAHTTGFTSVVDLMGYPWSGEMNASPEFDDAERWLYAVPLGTVIP